MRYIIPDNDDSRTSTLASHRPPRTWTKNGFDPSRKWRIHGPVGVLPRASADDVEVYLPALCDERLAQQEHYRLACKRGVGWRDCAPEALHRLSAIWREMEWSR